MARLRPDVSTLGGTSRYATLDPCELKVACSGKLGGARHASRGSVQVTCPEKCLLSPLYQEGQQGAAEALGHPQGKSACLSLHSAPRHLPLFHLPLPKSHSPSPLCRCTTPQGHLPPTAQLFSIPRAHRRQEGVLSTQVMAQDRQEGARPTLGDKAESHHWVRYHRATY